MVNISYMFSEDTLETKTFVLNTAENSYFVEYDHVLVQDAMDLIKARIIVCNTDKNAARYVNVSNYGIEVNGEKLIEIAWD